MKIGLGPYGMQAPPESGFSHVQLYREMLEQIEVAEELGYDSVWLTEHHFLPDGYLPALLACAAGMATRTSRIKIGLGVILLPLYDPIHLAEEAAVVDLLSEGRLIFGIAPGYRPEEFAGFRTPREKRGARMEEIMNILIRAWTQERFSFEGKFYSYTDMTVTPKPVQKPHPPIWIGASIKAGVRRVARYGLPLLASPRHRLEELEAHYAMYQDFCDTFGTQGPLRPVMRDVYVAETTAQAEAEAREHVVYIHREWYGAWSQWRPLTTDQGKRVVDKSEVQFEEIRGRFIIGDPDSVSQEIERYRQKLGMDYLIVRMQFPGLAHDKALRSMRLFAKEVMPRFADH